MTPVGRFRPMPVLLSVLAVGCVPMQSSGVPDWAMNIRQSRVDATYQAESAVKRLLVELERDEGLDFYLAPEQIALFSIAEIQKGHEADAALWLSIASYRYHQEAFRVAAGGQRRFHDLPANVRPQAYLKLVKAEIDLLGEEDFDEALDVLALRARGSTEKQFLLEEQLTSLGHTNAIERESVREAMQELDSGLQKEAGASSYPTLVDAFRRRLVKDAMATPEDLTPRYYLAVTPIPELQSAAMALMSDWFLPKMCWSIARAFPRQRPATIANLRAGDPKVRANAAATLALAPSDESLQALQKQLTAEKDERVRLALAFALSRHGVAEQVAPLNAAVRSCTEPTCTLAAGLINWLPAGAHKDVDREALAKLLRSAQVDRRARQFAAATLHDLGHESPLDAAAVEALIVAGRSSNTRDRLAELATEAVGEATVLTRESVLARLDITNPKADRQELMFPAPLLARLAALSVPADLPLLGSMMDRFGERSVREARLIIDATLHVPGADADARLINWFWRYPELRTYIAVGVTQRPGMPRDRVQRMLDSAGPRVLLALKMLHHTPDESQTMLAFLKGSRFDEIVAAADLAGASGSYAVEPLRRLLNYHNDQVYPYDALIRHLAMKALVRLALSEARPSSPSASPVVPAAVPAPAPGAPRSAP